MAEKIVDIIKLKKSTSTNIGSIELYSGEPIIVKHGTKYELYVGTETTTGKSTSKYNISNLANLEDTNVVSPKYEHSLVFDSTINKWVNGYPDGFKRYPSLPSVFTGNQIIYNNSVWTWNGSSYVNNTDTLDGKHLSEIINGTANYVPKFTGDNAIGDSIIYATADNVGIGTTDPSEKLDIKGNVKADGFKVGSGTNTKLLTDGGDTKLITDFATSSQGAKADTAIQGLKVNNIELTPDSNKIVEVPIMQGATLSLNGEAGLVPKPLSGQQEAFLRGDGTYGLPNADVVASASYIRGTLSPQLSCNAVAGGNVEMSLPYSYVARDAFADAVDIVRVIRNGLELVEGEDFTIERGIGDERKKITLIDYSLPPDDIILVRYKTSIGIYGSVFQETIDNAIIVTNNANTAAQRAEDAADREILLSESEYELLVQNGAVDLTKKYLIYEDDY